VGKREEELWLRELLEEGGRVVAKGTPEEITRNKNSFTGEYLKKALI
jgi:excinuclease UvrABC ATPase subunit